MWHIYKKYQFIIENDLILLTKLIALTQLFLNAGSFMCLKTSNAYAFN